MKIDRAGAPFIAGALIPAGVFVALRRPVLAAPFVALAGFMAYFFRDPDRQVPADPEAVLGAVFGVGPGGTA